MSHPHLIEDQAAREQFVYGGKAKFTLVGKVGRFTYKVSKKDDIYFVSVLNGPDNWENYMYIGFLKPEYGPGLKAGKKGHPNAPSFIALDWFMIHMDSDQVEFWHEGACAACGRALTVPESIESGFGPVCAGRIAA